MVNVDQWNNLSQFFIQTHSITLARFSKHCSVSVYTDIYEKSDKMKYHQFVIVPTFTELCEIWQGEKYFILTCLKA